jgi:hypothetical protein
MLLFGAYSFEGGDSFLLNKFERHYSEYRDKRISIFLSPMPASIVWKERPKGALMQTAFACVRDFASLKPCTGAFQPLDPDQPCAGWMRGRAFAPCTTPGSAAPCDPLEVLPV